MEFDPTRHHRRSIRLAGHEYSGNRAYYITIRTHGRARPLGRMDGESIRLSALGQIVEDRWRSIPAHHSGVKLDAWIVMPDHVHGVLILERDDAARRSDADAACDDRPRGPPAGSVGAIVGSFKSGVTKRINFIRSTPGAPFWQRNYYEHVIRNTGALDRIRRYIAGNPLRWEMRGRGGATGASLR